MPDSTLSGQTCLVTGADGFIGSHLTEALLKRGATVKALSLYNSYGQVGWLSHIERGASSSLEIIASDIRDSHAMARLCDGCDYIFHLASLIAIPHSYRAVQSYLDTNVGGVVNLLEAVRDKNVKQFIHVSTSEVYGSAQSVPITESHPLNAQSPYAASKIAADQMVIAYLRSFELPATVIRPFNTYGPRQSNRAVVPTIILQFVEGNTLQLGDTRPSRDFTYVTDIVEGLIRAAEVKPVGETIQLGSGVETTIDALADKIAGLMGKKYKVAKDTQRLRPAASEVMRLACDNRKAAHILGWQPKVSLDEGLRRTIDWFAVPRNRSRYSADYSL